MLKQKYLWLILVIILVVILSLYFFYNQRGKEEGTTEQTTEESEETEEYVEVEEAPVKIEKGTVVGMKAGEKEWEIEADKISLSQDRKMTIFEEVKKVVIFKDSKPHLYIQLNKCIADMESKSMELVGEVVIETEEEDILKGERFYWDAEEETLVNLEPAVELIVKENKITADWLTSDVELNNLELQGKVNVTFKID